MNEIARWKKEGYKEKKLLDYLRSLIGKGLFIHFTNEPRKIGFNPQGDYGLSNPFGFYGFPITYYLFNDIHFIKTIKNYIVIWKPKDGTNIANYNDPIVQKAIQGAEEEKLGTAEKKEDKTISWKDAYGFQGLQSKISLNLMNQGIDGIISMNGEMSTDIKEEIVVFKSSNVQVLDVKKNLFIEELEIEDTMNKAADEVYNNPNVMSYSQMGDPYQYDVGSQEFNRAQKGQKYKNIMDKAKYLGNRHRARRKDLK